MSEKLDGIRQNWDKKCPVITPDDIDWLIEQAEKAMELQQRVEYWQRVHREDCGELQLKITELKKKMCK
jgi:hypothetical protein